MFKVQNLLAKLGYDPGASDGILGTKTKKAIRKFQNDEGMTVDGQISNKLIERLRYEVLQSQ